MIALGLIIGAAIAYVYGTYQAETRRRAIAQESIDRAAGETAGDPHSEITNQDVQALFEEALALRPDDPELLARYGGFLFDMQRYAEAAEWFRRTLEIMPGDAEIRTALGTALYGTGRIEEAMEEYNRALESNPTEVMALHNLVIAYVEALRDLESAEAALARLEAVDPAYSGLESLRARIAAARNRP